VRKRVNVAIVSYLNTLPFIYGFQNHSAGINFKLIMATPRECAELFIKGQVDISLLPVGVLPTLPDYKIISNYCIGCDGKVRTVCLFYSNTFEEVTEILLDSDSRTSVLLIQIIMQKFYRKKVNFIPVDVENTKINIANHQALLAIGDKTFDLEKKYNKIDLGEVWKEWTALPFTFAAFVTNNALNDNVEKDLNACLEFGIQNISDLNYEKYSNIEDLEKYLTTNISYDLNEQKMKALNLFLSEISQLNYKN
jgi:chorismate dehydratase